ncbi:MAG: hypothetical protein LBD35_01845 [Prevotellaceae bacterium]|nr:hypothetical protein [Prevotellaceae bacterium]
MILSQKQRGESGRVRESSETAGHGRMDEWTNGRMDGRNTPCGRTVIAGLTRNLFHLPNTLLLSPPSAGHFK